jgi:vacuolar-type H+-ATPase subunit I/STV1
MESLMETIFSPDLNDDWKVAVMSKDLSKLIDYAGECYDACVASKGMLNEHQYPEKMMRIRDNLDRVHELTTRQERLRIEYEVNRTRLALALETVRHRQTVEAADNSLKLSMPESTSLANSYDGLDNLIEAWHLIVAVDDRQTLLKRPGTKISERQTAAAESDATYGLGLVALRRAVDAARKGEKSIFEFELEENTDFRFYPIDSVDEPWSHWVNSLRAAVLRVFNERCGCEKRLNEAKKKLNEAQFSQRLQEAIVAKNEEVAKKIYDCQQQLRAEYAAAILQGLATWRFIDRILSHLKTKMEENIQIIDAQRGAIPSTEMVARMVNCVSAYSWIQSIEHGRGKCINFNEVAHEQLARTAISGFVAVYNKSIG